MRKKISLILNDCEIDTANIRKLISVSLNDIKGSILLPLVTAIDEVVSNVVEHGFQDGCGYLKIIVYRSKYKIKIVVEDNGQEFDPTKLNYESYQELIDNEVEGRLGLRLVHKVLDKIHYQRIKDHNRVTLEKVVGK